MKTCNRESNYQVEVDETTGFKQRSGYRLSRIKTLIPTLIIEDKDGRAKRSHGLPVGAQLNVEEGNTKVTSGRDIG